MASEADELEQRGLMEAFCSAVEERGLAATTIADIVRHARVSKRTFYEHFADKEACFFAAYRAISVDVMRQVTAAVDFEASWEAQIEAAVRAYVAALDSRPKLTRAFFLEIHAVGPRAIGLRREVMSEFAELTRAFVGEAQRRQPALQPLTAAMATALVGGINELMLLKVERQMKLEELGDTAVALCKALVAPRRPR
ncbi:MAG TPA: TetR/AcrR family transcriptional regulator [Ideonella sp.]|nr:TetR/AcrR family transcriptional regulator [Ideonella sp.]